MYFKSLVSVLSLGFASFSYGAFTVSVQIGHLFDAENSLIEETAIWAIIYDADGNGILPGNLAANSNLTAGSIPDVLDDFAGANIVDNAVIAGDRILWAGIVDGLVTTGVAGLPGVDLENYTFAGNNIQANRMWGVYWFPTLTNSSRLLSLAGFQIGGIQIDSADTVSGGNIGMKFPSVDDTGTEYSAFFYSEDLDGSIPNSSFTAITAIPEPTVAWLSLLGGGAWVMRRRRS